MRRVAMHTQTHPEFALPRGWIVLGMALASWVVVVAMWSGMSQVFAFVAAAI